MTDHPILFSAPMVRANLAGLKTETRRIVKPQPAERLWEIFKRWPDQKYIARWAPGDRLWVRESWSGLHVFHDTKPSERQSFVGDGWPYLREDVWYWADGDPDSGDWERPRVSIHMPRWASRLTLLVKAVRVERLQDITDEGAIAEGVGPLCHPEGRRDLTWVGSPQVCRAPAYEFRKLWATIHRPDGPNGWDANPWVTVTQYFVENRNIDAPRDEMAAA